MTKDQALKHALEKFEYMNHVDSIFHGEFDFQINAIKKALAQQAEPDRGVYWKCVRCQYAHIEDECPHCGFNTRAEFKFPPSRQPLTDEEMKAIWYAMQNIMGWYSFQEIARAIEAAHGIKGEA
jgi:hypothetical protein